MTASNIITERVGFCASLAIVFISVAYVVTGMVWLVSHAGTASARRLEPSEPYLSILETLIWLSTPAIILLFAAIHSYAPAERKTFSRAAFGFAVLLGGITGVVHFLQLTAVRRTSNQLIKETFALYAAGGQLSPALAADLVAWDFFFGFALLFAGTVFRGDKMQNLIRVCLYLAGSLCLVGSTGPASGNLKFQYPAIVGYAFVFPFVCLLLAIHFYKLRSGSER
jgi:hypothetical protein